MLSFKSTNFGLKCLIILDNQVLIAINHAKYVKKKNPCTVKIFKCLQNHEASKYAYKSLKPKLTDLRNKVIIDETFNPIQDRGKRKNGFPTRFSPVTSTNVENSLQNFLTFSFTPFALVM